MLLWYLIDYFLNMSCVYMNNNHGGHLRRANYANYMLNIN